MAARGAGLLLWQIAALQEGAARVIIHGYTTLQLSRAFIDAAAVKKELKRAVKLLLFGMHKKI